MKSPEEMEKALRRLVPPALSAQAHADVSSMIASLAASSTHDTPPAEITEIAQPGKRRGPWYAAAAAVVMAGLTALNLPQAEQTLTITPDTANPQPTMVADAKSAPVLIDRMLVTDGITVEGTLAAADGTMMNQVQRRVETRERYRDARKGYLITVSETRNEKVLLPKKGF